MVDNGPFLVHVAVMSMLVPASLSLAHLGEVWRARSALEARPQVKMQNNMEIQTATAMAQSLMQKMDLDDRLDLLHGRGIAGLDTQRKHISSRDVYHIHGVEGAYVGNTLGNVDLGIPPLHLNDGSQGFRDEKNPGTTTAFPCSLAAAATWNPKAVESLGKAIGTEFRDKGANVLLGPGVNVARVPYNGRNFEYISGEDPYLGFKLAAPLIKGIQSKGVLATVKHWVNNNQETDRFDMNAVVSERTRFEMYYPPFLGAIQAGVASVMCGYNKINGFYACENNQTLRSDLREQLGFDGWVMSDWIATHTVEAIQKGLDQEMPDGDFFGAPLRKRVAVLEQHADDDDDHDDNARAFTSTSKLNKTDAISGKMIERSVLRILTQMFKVGVMADSKDGKTAFDVFNNPDKINRNVTRPEHVDLARRMAADSTILLKNDKQALPLPKRVHEGERKTLEDHGKKPTIAVVGRASDSGWGQRNCEGRSEEHRHPIPRYLRFPEEVGEPPKQLKGFERVFLQPGKAEDIEIRLTKRDISIFSETAHSWQIVRGKFEVMVGASSKDIKLRANIVL
eukprot:jgi/Bigna1/74531/fgenesh1_pg.29_\